MKKHFIGNNLDDIYLDVIHEITTHPEYQVSPRGMDIKEITNVTITLTDPTKSLITFEKRKLNYAFAAIEKLEYLSGQNNPSRITFYNKNFGSFINKYDFFDGAYAERFHYWRRYIYELLKSDPDTRQAVIPIYGQQDRHESKDIPCTIFHHFFVRENKLHMTVYMRSNDILWGLPYDINGFCFIQEAMAGILGYELGSYTHVVGSLHSYNEREHQLTELLNPDNQDKVIIQNPKLFNNENLTFEDLMNQLNLFWFLEDSLRKNKVINKSETQLIKGLQSYFEIIKKYVNKKYERQNNSKTN